jgi:uncharacterized damage-inducible protein DinB
MTNRQPDLTSGLVVHGEEYVMFRTLEDFLKSWEQESASTQKILDALTDKSLSQQIVDGHRTIGRIAWHVVTTIPEMMERTGLRVTAISHTAPVPAAAAEIQKGYAAVSLELIGQIKTHWNDGTLSVLDDMYGERWSRGLTLYILIIHQTHHRGQMTVLMRQAGLKVPGIYGPAKEEWVAYGAPAPEV